jgi:vacuolar-type H+-ATPase subunit I/STV1
LKLIDESLITDVTKMGELNAQALKFSQLADNITASVTSQGKGVLRNVDNNQFTTMAKTLRNFAEDYELTEEQITKIVNRFSDLQKRSKTTEEAVQKLANELKHLGNGASDVEKLTNEVVVLEGATNNVGNAMRQNLDTRMMIQNITSVVSAMGQLAMSISTLKNIGSI